MPRLGSLAIILVPTLGFICRGYGQGIDPASDRLPALYPDICGTGGERYGIAIFFEAGSASRFAGDYEGRMLEMRDQMRRDGGWVLLTGHLDAEEARHAPPGLDRARAEFVRNRLIALGIASNRIWGRGAGATDRMVVANTPELQNRRVERVLTHFGTACAARLRGAIHAWFSNNCFPRLRAADMADCDRALRLLQ